MGVIPEKNIQNLIMLACSKAGSILFRNNQGVAKYPDGSSVKYGICNPGGSDLIGFTPVTVTQAMVGKKVAIFTAVEVKTDSGRATDHQINFINVVRKHGGRAGIARSEQEAVDLILGGLV